MSLRGCWSTQGTAEWGQRPRWPPPRATWARHLGSSVSNGAPGDSVNPQGLGPPTHKTGAQRVLPVGKGREGRGKGAQESALSPQFGAKAGGTTARLSLSPPAIRAWMSLPVWLRRSCGRRATGGAEGARPQPWSAGPLGKPTPPPQPHPSTQLPPAPSPGSASVTEGTGPPS